MVDGSTSFDELPRGQGYGPAEISLSQLPGLKNQPLKYQELLATRYGPEPVEFSRPGRRRLNLYGTDIIPTLHFFGMPDQFDPRDDLIPLSTYSSPPNLHGRYGIGLDARGLPVAELNWARDDLRKASPYEIELSLSATR